MQRVPPPILAASLAIAVGCLPNEAPRPASEPATAERAAARPHEKTIASRSEPAAIVFEDFRGVAHLPQGHPCHDDATVAIIDDNAATGRVVEVTTFAKHRASLGEDDKNWVHLGPRTARGVRWSVGEEHYILAACNFEGLGFRSYDPEFLENPPSGGAVFSLGDCGECDDTERGEVRLMRRVAEGVWETIWDDVVWAGSDEGNNPEYIARGHVLEARDADGDRLPELVTYSLRPIDDRGSHTDERKPRFELTVTARESDHLLQERILLNRAGKLALRQRSEPPEAMPPATIELLSAALDASADVTNHARAVLTDAKKLNHR